MVTITIITSFLLASLTRVLSVPLVESHHTKEGYVPRLYNMNYIPAENLVPDWNNPWTFSPTFPRVVPPSSDMMTNFGLVPSYANHRGELLEENKQKRARDFSKFRLLRNSLGSEDGREEKYYQMKRNSVPMMG